MSSKFTLGVDKSTQKVKHISEVGNGLSCNCICVACNESLIAANAGKIRNHYFRHHIESDCKGGQETALHQLAKEIVLDNDLILIKDKNYFNYSNARAEVAYGGFEVDVEIENNDNQKWFVEIYVTRKKTEEDIQKYKKENVSTLEINLSKVDRKINRQDLTQQVLHSYNREIIVKRTEPWTPEEKIMGKVAGIGILILICSNWRKIMRMLPTKVRKRRIKRSS